VEKKTILEILPRPSTMPMVGSINLELWGRYILGPWGPCAFYKIISMWSRYELGRVLAVSRGAIRRLFQRNRKGHE
jgi:hypothetical protein